MSNTVGELKVKIGADLQELENALNRVKSDLEATDEGASEAAGSLSDIQTILTAIGAQKAIEWLVSQIKDAVKASIEFESAMAGVAKTTDFSAQELTAYGEAIKSMAEEIPLTTTELAGISEVAGQLGISGSENLLAFTDVMAKLGTATNMTSETAATMLAQFANITSMPTDQYSNLGSTIVDLGNNFATSESAITEMAQGMAAAATNAGIAEPEILALATAASSVGIEAAAGSTSWAQLIAKIQTAVETGEDLDKWATVAGVSADEFKTAWGDNATNAINMFITGMKRTSDEGTSMIATLKDLGIVEIRQQRLVQSLANADGLLAKAITKGNAAWEENIALNKEAATRFQTTESKMQLLNNKVANLKTTIGDQLAPAFNNVLDVLTQVIDGFNDFAEKNEWLGPVLATVTAALVAYIGAISGKIIIDKVATIVQQGLNAAVMANPYVLLAVAIVGATTALITFCSQASRATDEMEALNEKADSLKETQAAYADAMESAQSAMEKNANYTEVLIGRIEALGSKQNRTQQETWLLESAVDELNGMYEGLDLSIDDVSKGLTAQQKQLIRTAKEEAKATAATEAIESAYKAMAEAEALEREATIQLQREYDALTPAQQAAADAMIALSERYKEGTASSIELGIAYAALDEETRTYINSVGAHNEIMAEASAAYEQGESDVETYTALLDEQTRAEIEAKTGLTELSGEQQANAESYININETLKTNIAELIATYEELRSEIYENLWAEYDWQEGLSATPVDLNKVTTAMTSSVEAMKNYRSNLQILKQYGVDDLAAIGRQMNMSTEDLMGLADELAKNPDAIPAFLEAYAELESEFSNTAANLADEELGVTDKLAEFIDTYGTELEGLNLGSLTSEYARDTMQSIIDAYDDMEGDVYAKIDELVRGMRSKFGTQQFKFSTKSYGSGLGITVSAHDTGGYFTQPHLAVVAEKRPEFVGAAEDLETYINKSISNAFVNVQTPIPNYGNSSKETNITVNVPIEVSQELSEGDIKNKAMMITRIIGREMALSAGGRL